MRIRRVFAGTFLCFAMMAPVMAQTQRVMLVVTAHPDDELFMGPVLARYAREHVKVYLAISTQGEKGVRDHAGIAAGEPLAAARREEATCSCKQLGIDPPIFFNLKDGELGAISAKNVQAVADNVEQQIKKMNPDAIVTWGPEGGYGHPDHRLVSDAVTQIVQARKSNIKLFYAGLTTAQASVINDNDSGPWHGSQLWYSTHPAYLPVRVTFTKTDQAAFHKAVECHKSQFTPEEMQKVAKALAHAWVDGVSYRPWRGGKRSDSLFK
jgi:LmbE family N-acetylglucosaminyl deacetylase